MNTKNIKTKKFIWLATLTMLLAFSVPVVAQQWEEHEGNPEFHRMRVEMEQLRDRIAVDQQRLNEESARLRSDQEQMERLRHRMEEMHEHGREGR